MSAIRKPTTIFFFFLLPQTETETEPQSLLASKLKAETSQQTTQQMALAEGASEAAYGEIHNRSIKEL